MTVPLKKESEPDSFFSSTSADLKKPFICKRSRHFGFYESDAKMQLGSPLQLEPIGFLFY